MFIFLKYRTFFLNANLHICMAQHVDFLMKTVFVNLKVGLTFAINMCSKQNSKLQTQRQNETKNARNLSSMNMRSRDITKKFGVEMPRIFLQYILATITIASLFAYFHFFF